MHRREGGKQPELVIVHYRIKVDVTLSKLIIVQSYLKKGKKCGKKSAESISANLHTKN